MKTAGHMEEKSKKERLAVRTTARVKQVIEEAASLEGRSVSDFIIEHAQVAALDVIERQNRIVLTYKDSAIFVEALLGPPEPNEKLKRAARRHKEMITGK